jgi:uncharacterized membrane protein
MIIAQIKKADVTIAFIIGAMFGALYSYTDYDNEREHTLQVCIFIISITIEWTDISTG